MPAVISVAKRRPDPECRPSKYGLGRATLARHRPARSSARTPDTTTCSSVSSAPPLDEPIPEYSRTTCTSAPARRRPLSTSPQAPIHWVHHGATPSIQRARPTNHFKENNDPRPLGRHEPAQNAPVQIARHVETVGDIAHRGIVVAARRSRDCFAIARNEPPAAPASGNFSWSRALASAGAPVMSWEPAISNPLGNATVDVVQPKWVGSNDPTGRASWRPGCNTAIRTVRQHCADGAAPPIARGYGRAPHTPLSLSR